jgi:hypothetical protein
MGEKGPGGGGGWAKKDHARGSSTGALCTGFTLVFINSCTIVQTIGKFSNVHLFLEDFLMVCMKSTMGSEVV